MSTAYATAWYGLHDLARISSGDKVLIHSATGGVGQAAIAIARAAGAEIFATAGSPQRRELLRDMGIEHVYDSRSTEFADLIRRDTDGYGVDIVLNSLTGAAQRAGLELLAFGGRFVEIGKRDIYGDTRLGLFPFRRNLVVLLRRPGADVCQPPRAGPATCCVRCTGSSQTVSCRRRETHALPACRGGHRDPRDERGGAHRQARARHTARAGSSSVVVPPERAQVFRARRRLHHHGWPGWARAVPRRGDGRGGLWPDRAQPAARSPNPEAQKTIERIRATGADIHVECGNIAEPDTAARLVATATATGLPVRGVLHAAAVVEDATLTNITDELIDRDWAPKVLRRVALALRHGRLSHWTGSARFSSAAALLGSPGQGAYAAANSWLDGFAHWRRAQGLPATAIAWGAWAEIGRAAALAEQCGEPQ